MTISTPTPNQLSQDNLENNVLLNAINSPDKIPFTWDLSNGYNTIEMLMYVKGKKSRPVNGYGGVIQKPIMGTSRVIAQVLTSTVSGSNLVLTFVDSTYKLFRLKRAVIDGTPSANTGRVITTAPGTITLEPSPDIVAQGGWNPAIHFPIGSYALDAYDVSGFWDSEASSPLFEVPFFVTDMVSTTRAFLPLKDSDFFATYTKWKGSQFWANGQETFMWRQFSRDKINRWYFGPGVGTYSSGLEGDVNYVLGLRKTVMDQYRGGNYVGFTSVLTQAQWESWLTDTADLQVQMGGGDQRLTILVGRQLWKRVQSFTAPYIQYSGMQNTFGGSKVRGLNVREYSYGGVVADIILDPVLNDLASYVQGSAIPGVTGSIRANTAIALDLGDYPAPDNSGMLPSLEELYWDYNGNQTIFAYEPGLLGGSSKSQMFNMAKSIASNGSPVQKLHLYEKTGTSFIMNRCGWLEPAY